MSKTKSDDMGVTDNPTDLKVKNPVTKFSTAGAKIGEMVYYRPARRDQFQPYEQKARVALVCDVNEVNQTVTLGGFDRLGNPFNAHNVHLLQPGEDPIGLEAFASYDADYLPYEPAKDFEVNQNANPGFNPNPDLPINQQ